MAMEAAAGSSLAPNIIIAGAPASGKGTQCSMIKERYGVVHLSTGRGYKVDADELLYSEDCSRNAPSFCASALLMADCSADCTTCTVCFDSSCGWY